MLDVAQFSLNGDYGSYFDGQPVICTIDKTEYDVAFSFMAQISKSDFGIFYGVIPASLRSGSLMNNIHSDAVGRSPIYILPAVYLMPKPPKPASSEGGGQGSEES